MSQKGLGEREVRGMLGKYNLLTRLGNRVIEKEDNRLNYTEYRGGKRKRERHRERRERVELEERRNRDGTKEKEFC